MQAAAVRPRRIYTPKMVQKLIDEEQRAIVINHNKVYDVTKFLPYHPGGKLALLAVNGKDATDVLDAFHPQAMLAKKLPAYYIGEFIAADSALLEDSALASGAVAMTPILMAEEEERMRACQDESRASTSKLAKAYLDLHQKLVRLGYYEPNYWFYARRAIGFLLWFGAAIGLAVFNPTSTAALFVSAVMLGAFWHGLAFTAHDLGHHSVTCNRRIDDLIGVFVATYFGGLSITWWQVNHNVHHIVTNEPEHDPDIQHLPLFAVSTRFFEDLYSTFHRRIMKFDAFARICVAIQHYLFIPVLTFGRFNLYAQSLNHLLNSHPDGKKYRGLELVGMLVFWTWFGYGMLFNVIDNWPQRLMYLYVSHACTVFLHIQITLSHFAMSTELDNENELFAEKALRTTMNVDCPEWFDWFHGGLQFQIEHHLFPRIPRVHFRKLRPIVKEFCKEHNLEYVEYTFLHGNGKVLGALAEVAHQVKFIVDSADPSKRFATKKNI